MNFLNFLDDVVIESVEPKAGRTIAKKERNPAPEFVGIRVWKDGSVYPSEKLVKDFNLEYRTATVNTITDKTGKQKKVLTVVGDQGNALDIIDVRQWSQAKASNKNFIAVGFAPKDAPKVDLFGLTRFDSETGAPLSSVLTQGTAAFGKETLLPLIKELYNVEPNEEGFIDLAIAVDKKNLRSENGLEYLPKKVTRGEHKGKSDYVKRENVDIFMLYPVVEPVTDVQGSENPAGIAEDEAEDIVNEAPGKDVSSAVAEEAIA